MSPEYRIQKPLIKMSPEYRIQKPLIKMSPEDYNTETINKNVP